MKAVILAGGHATRLKPITNDRPKPLLPLGDRPIIDYLVEEIPNNVEIIISTNMKFEEEFREYSESKDRKVRLFVEDQDNESAKPGTVGGMIKLLEEENLNDDLLIIGGDNYFSFDLQNFVELGENKGSCVAAKSVPEEIAGNFGVLRTEGGIVVDFEEKPDQPSSNLASTACYFFEQQDLEIFNKYLSHVEANGLEKKKYLDAPGRLLEYMVSQTQIHCFDFEGKWFDIGTPEGYLEAVRNIDSAQVVLGEETESEIQNSMALEGTKISDSEVDNCILMSGVEVENCKLKNCIVDADSKIIGKNLDDSVVGNGSIIK